MSDTLSSPPLRRTPEHLLRTAERLYAAQGIDAVSLRQIASVAGQRDPAAVQYHFGSKDGLLRAIIDFRLPTINERRLQLLDALEAGGQSKDPRGVTEALVWPLLEQEPPESHYVGFLARFLVHRRAVRNAFGTLGDLGLSGRRVAQAFSAILEGYSPAVQANRKAMAFDLMLVTLDARYQRQADGEEEALTRDELVADLVDGIVGLLTAPHTPVGPP